MIKNLVASEFWNYRFPKPAEIFKTKSPIIALFCAFCATILLFRYHEFVEYDFLYVLLIFHNVPF